MLLAEPIERTPLRAGGRVGRGVHRDHLLHRRDRRDRRRDRRRDAAQPVLQRARAGRSTWSALAALFLLLRAEFVAAAQVIVYAGAVMVLYVFVVAYVGGGERAHRAAARCGSSARCSRWRWRSSCASRCSAPALKGINGKGAPYVPGFGTPAHDRQAVPDQVPVPVRGRLDAAAGGGGRRRRARAAPARARARRASSSARSSAAAAGVHRHDGRGRPASACRRTPRAHARRGPSRSAAPGSDRPRARRAADDDRLVPGRLRDHLLHRRRRRARPAQPARDPALPRADAQRRQPRAGRVRAHVGRRGRPDLRADRDGGGRLRGDGRARPDRRDLPPPAADRRRRAERAPSG